MFCHTAGDYVVPELVWLARELAQRPGDEFAYSWGSAVLAATYRGLCDASQRSGTTSNLTGCLHLLQMWSWEYFPVCRPRIFIAYYPVDNLQDIPGDARPTMGYRWTHARLRWAQEQDHSSYPRAVADFDVLTADRVSWDPWTPPRMAEIASGGMLAPSCTADSHLWMTTCRLIYMNCVEVYSPERVQRQFGYAQVVPVPPARQAGREHG